MLSGINSSFRDTIVKPERHKYRFDYHGKQTSVGQWNNKLILKINPKKTWQNSLKYTLCLNSINIDSKCIIFYLLSYLFYNIYSTELPSNINIAQYFSGVIDSVNKEWVALIPIMDEDWTNLRNIMGVFAP